VDENTPSLDDTYSFHTTSIVPVSTFPFIPSHLTDNLSPAFCCFGYVVLMLCSMMPMCQIYDNQISTQPVSFTLLLPQCRLRCCHVHVAVFFELYLQMTRCASYIDPRDSAVFSRIKQQPPFHHLASKPFVAMSKGLQPHILSCQAFYSKMAHSALPCDDIPIVFFVAVKL